MRVAAARGRAQRPQKVEVASSGNVSEGPQESLGLVRPSSSHLPWSIGIDVIKCVCKMWGFIVKSMISREIMNEPKY